MTITATITLENAAGVSAAVVNQLRALTLTAADAWGSVLAGNATPNIVVTIAQTTPSGRAHGGNETSAYLGTNGGNSVFEPGTAYELRTGRELGQSGADIHITIARDYLLNELFLDPTPKTVRDLPPNRTDGLSVLIHEIGHALGFIGYYNEANDSFYSNANTPYDTNLLVRRGAVYFAGDNVQAVYGGAVPLTRGNYAHYGNSNAFPGTSDDPLTGLMNGVVYHRGYRYGIGAIDLAILADNGVGTIADDIFTIGLMRAFNGGAGVDTVRFDTIDAGVTLSLGRAGPQETGGAGIVELTAIENVLGTAAADRLTGSAAANRIDGGAGADTLAGAAGADMLFGGRGADTLIGGSGADRFVFGTRDTLVAAPDLIRDFTRADGDRIDLSTFDGDATQRGINPFTFISRAAFSGEAGELRWERRGGETWLMGDTDGDGDAEMAVRLAGQPAIVTAELILAPPGAAPARMVDPSDGGSMAGWLPMSAGLEPAAAIYTIV